MILIYARKLYSTIQLGAFASKLIKIIYFDYLVKNLSSDKEKQEREKLIWFLSVL